MREQRQGSVSAVPTTDNSGSGALFIITLSSSTAPMALEVPSLPELAGLAVFRSRRVEDGRDRFRMHVGYFESPEAAESVLPSVREYFPAAWVGPAPSSGMGSLDDTSVAEFKFIKAPNTISRDPSGTFRVPVAQRVAATATPAPAPPRNGSTSSRLRALLGPSTPPHRLAAVVEAATKATKAPAAGPMPGKHKSSPPPAKPNALLSPKQVFSLLESSAPSMVARVATMTARERAAVIGAIQRFAVQLVWTTSPIDLTSVAKLAIFDAYTLYKVQVDRAGRRWYGLRLGFFADPVSARQVALYARSDFSAAAVVPVSDRECDRAAQAAVKELPEALAAPKAEEPLALIEEPQPPAKVEAPVAKPVAGAKPAVPAAAPTEKGRRIKTPAEMAADLQEEEPEFQMGTGDDPLNDTGVRHLAVKVVKKKPKLGLFSRNPRRF